MSALLRRLAFAVLALAAWGPALADPIRIVALGTSFTAGKGVWQSDAFPAQLEKLLKAADVDARVANEGINGNSTLDILARLERAVPPGVALVIYEYALGNDERAGLSREATLRNSGEIISRLLARNAQVLLVIRGRNRHQLERNVEWLGETVAKYGIAQVAIEQPPSTLLPDRQHPTAAAHAQIAADMLPQVRALLAKATTSTK